MAELQLEGRVAIVTGASGRLGRAAARRFAAAGARVMLADLSRSVEADDVSTRDGIEWFLGDLTEPTANDALVEATLAAFGRIDILLTSAASVRWGSASETSKADWVHTIEHELTIAFLTCKHVLAPMVAAGRGSIVNVASVSGLRGVAGHVAHAATKMGTIGLTRQLAVEYGPKGIRCNAVAPGPIVAATRPAAETPLGRGATADDFAEAVLFLASDAASAVTGQVLVVDGGATIAWGSRSRGV